MENKLQARVARRLIFFILAIIILMGGYLYWRFEQASSQLHRVSESSLNEALMTQLHKKGVDTTVYMSNALANALYNYDIEQINKMIADVTRQHDITHAYVFDEHNKILHDGTGLINTSGEEIPATIALGLANAPTRVFDIKLKQHLIFAGNAFINGDKIGGIVLEFSLADIHGDIDQVTQAAAAIEDERSSASIYDIAIIAALLALLGSVVAWRMTHKFVSPITRLADYASHIGRGNYDFTVEVSSKDNEITNLGRAFEKMRDGLQSSSLRIRHLTYHDTLTNLPNRQQFKEKLELAVKQDSNRFALLLIDIDNFKRINDDFGHDFSDKLLIELADRLRGLPESRQDTEQDASGCEPEQPIVARIGSDEFTIILFDVDDDNLVAGIAEQILNKLRQPYFIDGQKIQIGVSVGIAMWPKDGQSALELMRNADVAMYQAKLSNKKQYQFYGDEITLIPRIEQDLKQALARREFELHYQPKYDFAEGRFNSAEALIRWRHPTEGDMSPAVFIPVAERSDLIFAIGEWVIEAACQQLKVWHGMAPSGFSIAINISVIQLQQADLAKVIFDHLDKYQIPHHLLEIEITETAVMESEEDAVKILSRLSDQGIRIWLDDFGTGFSSLAYLRKLPVYGIKIDRSFTRDIETNNDDKKLCEAMIAMGHRLGLKVVAEGVEEKAQEQIIKALGCDHAQGFLYGKPQPALTMSAHGRLNLNKHPSDNAARPLIS